MKIIKSLGKVPMDILVDDDVYEWASKKSWILHYKGSKGSPSGPYPRTGYMVNGKQVHFTLHRLIMGNPEGKVVDHRDRNTLNCQRYNLRICTQVENLRNRGSRKNSSSRFIGVSFIKSAKRPGSRKWRAIIRYNEKNLYLGSFVDERQAAVAYNDAAIKYRGEFAGLNVIT